MITRIAPTPSGYLHKGNIYNFLLNWLMARASGGKVVLRIDDADTERKRIEYVEDIFRVLDALELDWDIGPSGPDELESKWSQTFRMDLYHSLLQKLKNAEVIYACQCSRTKYAGENQHCRCKHMELPLQDFSSAWKINIPRETKISVIDKEPKLIDINDFVVRKKDGRPSYSVASLADDLHFGVTHIVRGEDLFESTARQLYLDSLLPHPSFHQVRFWHHQLLRNEAGEKLSKSTGVQSFSILKNGSPLRILHDFALWMGWRVDQYSTLSEMVRHPMWKE
jgi:glutamyl/glutaminyl-tRNA synthetase